MRGRRPAVAVAVLALVTAGIASGPAASALPDPVTPTVVSGGLASDAGSPVLTWTQTTPGVTIVEVADLDVAAGESLVVHQAPGDVLVVRITDPASAAVVAGSIAADASLYVIRSGAHDIRVDAGGSITTGGRLVLSSGDATNADLATPDEVDLAYGGTGDVAVAGTVLSGGGAALYGALVEVAGSVAVTGEGDVAMLSGLTAGVRFTSSTWTVGASVAGGGVTVSGSVTSRAGAAILYTNSPVAATGLIIAERGPVSFPVSGSLAGPALDSRATGDGTPAGQATGARFTQGAGSISISGTALTLVALAGVAVHGQAAAAAQDVALQPDGFHIDLAFASCDSVSLPASFAGVSVTGLSSPLVADVLAGFDPSIPNQAPIDLGVEGRVYVNEQSTSTVGGYEILHVTALRFETPTGTYTFGEAACGRLLPTGGGGGAGGGAGGGSSLPPTGPRDPALPLAAAVLAIALGILLVRRGALVKPPVAAPSAP